MEEGTYTWYKDISARPENEHGEWFKFVVKNTDDGATCQRSLIWNENNEKSYISLDNNEVLSRGGYQLVPWTHPKPPKSREYSCPKT